METKSIAFVIVLILFVSFSVHAYGADEGDLVTGLPGQPAVNFKHYAGYVTLDPDADDSRSLFYWFFEADHPNASSLPLALWLQGGPGCSSIGSGAVAEIGPFLLRDGTLVRNSLSWNKEVNLIFLDSPVATGFSYTTNANYSYTDQNIAMDTYQFLVGWLKKFPEYRANDLVLLGESYAGHYVPQLAAEILLQNNHNNSCHINLKGFNIGNPWTDPFSDNGGTLHWYLSHSLISEETFDLAWGHCDLNNSYFIGDVGDLSCKDASAQIQDDTKEIDINNVYKDTCNKENSSWSLSSQPSAQVCSMGRILGYSADLCAGNGASEYFNSEEVQKALHVHKTPVAWADCSNDIYGLYRHEDVVSSMLSTYTHLLESDIKIWIYSGDWDANVPTTCTQNWIKRLSLPIVTKWYPWDYQSQVGGWTQVYKGLTFTTVRAAGHMVPKDQPGKALQVFKSFLAGELLPVFHLV